MCTRAGTHHIVARQAAAAPAAKLRSKGRRNCKVTKACDVVTAGIMS